MHGAITGRRPGGPTRACVRASPSFGRRSHCTRCNPYLPGNRRTPSAARMIALEFNGNRGRAAMYRRDLRKSAGAALGGAALLTAHTATAEQRARGSNTGRIAGPFVETRDGTQLFYRDWGSGTPLVFLSGWALTSDCWGYQTAPLSDSGLRCIAYDRRGHGRSSDPGRGFDFDTLADDLAAVLDALDLKNVTLVAHSMAGGEAVRYLSRHGSERAARVALVDRAG